MDYFSLLGVEQKFDIDLVTLEKNYLELQKEFHPDRFVKASPAERLMVTQKVADINQGYEILKSFQKRAEYLLKTVGYELTEKELTKNVDQETLLESIELRERMASLENVVEIENLTREVAGKKKELLDILKKLFTDKNYKSAYSQLIRLKYLDKFLLEAKNTLLKIGQKNAY